MRKKWVNWKYISSPFLSRDHPPPPPTACTSPPLPSPPLSLVNRWPSPVAPSTILHAFPPSRHIPSPLSPSPTIGRMTSTERDGGRGGINREWGGGEEGNLGNRISNLPPPCVRPNSWFCQVDWCDRGERDWWNWKRLRKNRYNWQSVSAGDGQKRSNVYGQLPAKYSLKGNNSLLNTPPPPLFLFGLLSSQTLVRYATRVVSRENKERAKRVFYSRKREKSYI